jgi:hypothetical protein
MTGMIQRPWTVATPVVVLSGRPGSRHCRRPWSAGITRGDQPIQPTSGLRQLRTVSDRSCFGAIVYVAPTSTPWRLLPAQELGCGVVGSGHGSPGVGWSPRPGLAGTVGGSSGRCRGLAAGGGLGCGGTAIRGGGSRSSCWPARWCAATGSDRPEGGVGRRRRADRLGWSQGAVRVDAADACRAIGASGRPPAAARPETRGRTRDVPPGAGGPAAAPRQSRARTPRTRIASANTPARPLPHGSR